MAVLLCEPEAWRPRVSVPATYRLGTVRNQHSAVARWHAHLRGLATAIQEISGLAPTSRSINKLSPLCHPTKSIQLKSLTLSLLGTAIAGDDFIHGRGIMQVKTHRLSSLSVVCCAF